MSGVLAERDLCVKLAHSIIRRLSLPAGFFTHVFTPYSMAQSNGGGGLPGGPERKRFDWENSRVMRRWRTYMGYSKSEARGSVVLMLLIVAVLFVPLLVRPLFDAPENYDDAQDRRDLDALVAQLNEHRLRSGDRKFPSRYPARGGGYAGRGSKYPVVAQVALAAFDPNTLDATGWEARGVPHFVAVRIAKYREMAGGFKAKSQIKKMYGLEPAVYNRLAPFVQLPEEMPKRGERPDFAKGDAFGKEAFGKDGLPGKFARKPRNLQPFDLNTADTTQLMQIRGIGRGYAKGIVKQRDRLGGFISAAQLAEVWHLREAPDLVDSLRKYTFVTPGFRPGMVRLNSGSFDELWGHPYIGKPVARRLVAYRTMHGAYKTMEEVVRGTLMKPEDAERLRPYAAFE